MCFCGVAGCGIVGSETSGHFMFFAAVLCLKTLVLTKYFLFAPQVTNRQRALTLHHGSSWMEQDAVLSNISLMPPAWYWRDHSIFPGTRQLTPILPPLFARTDYRTCGLFT